MKPQYAAWNNLVLHQQLDSVRREEQQKAIKKYLKQKYQIQLQSQIDHKRLNERKRKEQQKKKQRDSIIRNLEHQKKIIETQRNKTLENPHVNLNPEKEEKQSQRQPYYQKICHDLNIQQSLRTKKLSEGSQVEALPYKYSLLKQTPSNLIPQDKINHLRPKLFPQIPRKKTLIERKREQWKNDQIYVRYSSQMEEKCDRQDSEVWNQKLGLQKVYNQELKKQISQQQLMKKANSKKQLQNDKYWIGQWENLRKSENLDIQIKKNEQKRELGFFLEKQIKEKSTQRELKGYLHDRQEIINRDILRKRGGLVPGETYDLDPSRKKQVEMVAKGLWKEAPELNYLAQKGKGIFD